MEKNHSSGGEAKRVDEQNRQAGGLRAGFSPLGVWAFSIGASIGIADFPGDSDDADDLLRHADQAMYAAKKKGRNCWHLYGDQIGGAETAKE